MLRGGIDQLMGYQLTPVLVVMAYGVAMIWALRRTMTPVLIVNIASAAIVALYILPAPGRSVVFFDLITGLAFFELAVLGLSGAALAGARVPAWLVWTGFAINFFFAAALAVFLLTFKMTRLF